MLKTPYKIIDSLHNISRMEEIITLPSISPIPIPSYLKYFVVPTSEEKIIRQFLIEIDTYLLTIWGKKQFAANVASLGLSLKEWLEGNKEGLSLF